MAKQFKFDPKPELNPFTMAHTNSIGQASGQSSQAKRMALITHSTETHDYQRHLEWSETAICCAWACFKWLQVITPLLHCSPNPCGLRNQLADPDQFKRNLFQNHSLKF